MLRNLCAIILCVLSNRFNNLLLRDLFRHRHTSLSFPVGSSAVIPLAEPYNGILDLSGGIVLREKFANALHRDLQPGFLVCLFHG